MRSAEPTPASELRVRKEFKARHPDLFQKNDLLLAIHLTVVLALLAGLTFLTIWVAFIPLKILLGMVAALFWFSLVNVTMHHHHAHHNAAASPALAKVLDVLYYLLP